MILRHAKSDWNADYGGDDHDRPLNARGCGAAALVGRFLEASGRHPDRIVSSTAERAHDTVRRAARAGAWPSPIETEARLYDATVDRVLTVVAECPDDIQRLLIAGHEPTSSALVHRLTGARVRFPTAALAELRLPIQSWRDVGDTVGELLWLVVPKLIAPLLDDD